MTLAELYRKTLEKLEIVAAGESAAPEDTQFIASKYVSVWNQLRPKGLVSWSVTDAVPDDVAQAIIDMLVYASADEFGEDSKRYVATGSIGLAPPSLAEMHLRQIHAQEYVSTPAESEYF